MINSPVFYLEDNVTDRAVLTFWITVGQLTTYHAFDDTVFGEVILAFMQSFDGMTVTDDGDRVSNIADLVQFMGNNDTGQTLCFQLQHQFQQLCGFTVVQSSGRLVQNQQVGFFAQCFCDLDQLLFANTKAIDRYVNIFIFQTNASQQFLCFAAGSGPVDDAFACQTFVTDEYVFGNGQIWAQRQLLMDDNDTFCFGFTNVVEFADLTVVHDIAAVLTIRINTGQNVHEGGFTCAVFAADRHDLALTHFQINVIQCFYAGKFLGDVVHFQDIF